MDSRFCSALDRRNQAPRAGPDIRNPEYGIWNTEPAPKEKEAENPEYGIRNMEYRTHPQGEGGRESGIRNTEYGIRNQAPRAGPDIRNPEYGIWNTELSPKVGHGEQEKGVNG